MADITAAALTDWLTRSYPPKHGYRYDVTPDAVDGWFTVATVDDSGMPLIGGYTVVRGDGLIVHLSSNPFIHDATIIGEVLAEVAHDPDATADSITDIIGVRTAARHDQPHAVAPAAAGEYLDSCLAIHLAITPQPCPWPGCAARVPVGTLTDGFNEFPASLSHDHAVHQVVLPAAVAERMVERDFVAPGWDEMAVDAVRACEPDTGALDVHTFDEWPGVRWVWVPGQRGGGSWVVELRPLRVTRVASSQVADPSSVIAQVVNTGGNGETRSWGVD